MNKPKQRSCLFCSEPHFSRECKIYASSKQRKEQLGQLGQCTKCCRVHPAKQTSEVYPYRKYSGSHHSLLCNSNMKFGEHPQITAAIVQTVKMNETTALPVATAQVVCQNRGTRHSVLLNTESQCTFITKRLATTLKLKPIKATKLQVEGFLGILHIRVMM